MRVFAGSIIILCEVFIMNQNPQQFNNQPNGQNYPPQAPQGYQQPAPQYNQPQYNQPQYNQPMYPQPYNGPGKGYAIAAMVLGIIGAVFCWFGWFCIIALALSIVAIVLAVKARNSMPLGVQGRGMATAGLVLGIIGASLSGVASACWISIIACAGSVANSAATLLY